MLLSNRLSSNLNWLNYNIIFNQKNIATTISWILGTIHYKVFPNSLGFFINVLHSSIYKFDKILHNYKVNSFKVNQILCLLSFNVNVWYKGSKCQKPWICIIFKVLRSYSLINNVLLYLHLRKEVGSTCLESFVGWTQLDSLKQEWERDTQEI